MIQEIAADHALQVTQGKKQLLDRATGALHQEHEKQHQDENQTKESELFQLIGRLQIALE